MGIRETFCETHKRAKEFPEGLIEEGFVIASELKELRVRKKKRLAIDECPDEVESMGTATIHYAIYPYKTMLALAVAEIDRRFLK